MNVIDGRFERRVLQPYILRIIERIVQLVQVLLVPDLLQNIIFLDPPRFFLVTTSVGILHGHVHPKALRLGHCLLPRLVLRRLFWITSESLGLGNPLPLISGFLISTNVVVNGFLISLRNRLGHRVWDLSIIGLQTRSNYF